MSLLKPRDYYKPFQYPWAFEAYETMFHDMHWSPSEAPMMDDIKDWNTKITPSEREFLTQLFRFFTQADVDVARGYREKYINRFPHPEITMMLFSFGAAEANHIHAYSTLMETLGISEGEFRAFTDYKAMREKHDYMFDRDTGKSIADLMVDLAVFSAFGEGMQLFSSFALLMNFQRRGLMKGMTTIVEWSIRDETHHVENMLKLFHALREEHGGAWTDETKKRIYDTCRNMVDLEDAFIDQAFSFGPVEGVTPEEAKAYIRFIADRRLLQLGLKPNYGQKSNPFEWLDEIMNIPTHTNFFEQRSTDYSKEEIEGWESAFAEMDRGAFKPNLTQVTGAQFRVITKPDCPHCTRAKDALSDRGIQFISIKIDDAEQRKKALEGLNGWTTFPVIHKLSPTGEPTQFIGGADALIGYLEAVDEVKASLISPPLAEAGCTDDAVCTLH